MYDAKQIGDRLREAFGQTNKAAVFTGSAQGLGRATAQLFSEVIADLNLDAANRSKAEMFEMTTQQWNAMLNVTLRGTFWCSRAAISRMKKRGQGGAIVNISSVGAIHPTIWGIRGPIIGAGRIPMGRTAALLEVAQAVVFLTSPAASYLTGQIVAADGGFMVS